MNKIHNNNPLHSKQPYIKYITLPPYLVQYLHQTCAKDQITQINPQLYIPTSLLTNSLYSLLTLYLYSKLYLPKAKHANEEKFDFERFHKSVTVQAYNN